jgi:hypothetical protein
MAGGHLNRQKHLETKAHHFNREHILAVENFRALVLFVVVTPAMASGLICLTRRV